VTSQGDIRRKRMRVLSRAAEDAGMESVAVRLVTFPPPFRPRPRQNPPQLQVLRDLGLLAFLGAGSYRLA
jgi:hypothetical protein